VARTLEPDDRITHFRIVGPLGAGGMGEVYLAQDTRLERSVALKILPPALVRSDERLRRFVAEAKSASSLNHPNIVTIYEIGRDRVKPARGGGDPAVEAEPIHYISMELVAGDTLDTLIHSSRADLRALIGWLAQAAEGIAKAHASGIVHRDLKPGNIMVSKDGFAKVLDFGLAKLTERTQLSDAERTSAPTEAAVTGAGTVMGTVGYMSPEQVQGRPVDHRSDIFSLGCILYEAATRARPFPADSDIEVMHRILKEKPRPVEELNPEAPGELRRVIRRCLAKAPDERFQSMKDVAIDLREMFEGWETLSPSTPSGSTSGSIPVARGGDRRKLVVAAAVVIGLGVGLYALVHRGAPASPAAGNDLKVSVLMSRGDLAQTDRGAAMLSADGRYLAYVIHKNDTGSLLIRQVRTGSDVVVIADNPTPIRNIAFSHDGDFLYFTNRDPESPNYSALFQVPSLGGTPRKLLFDVDSAPAFSPDGRRACFRRGFPQNGADTLQIAELDTGATKELVRIKDPEVIATDPDWSPDGTTVLIAVKSPTGGYKARLRAIDVASGAVTTIPPDWMGVTSARFMPGGRAILATALENVGRPQIVRIGYPGGGAVRLTNDFDGYGDLSIAADGASVAAVRNVQVENLWTARLGKAWEAQPITFASGSAASVRGIAPLPGDRVAFATADGDVVRLFSMKSDGSDRRPMNSSGIFILEASYVKQMGLVFSQVDREKDGKVVAHLWRVDPDGGALAQLTRGAGEEVYAASPRGDAALFWQWDEPKSLFVLKAGGGPPVKITDRNQLPTPRISPDGTRVLYATLDQEGDRARTNLHIAPLDGGADLMTFPLPPRSIWHEWAPDSGGITYIDGAHGYDIMRQSIAGGTPQVLAHAAEGIIEGYRFSPDGAWLAFGTRTGSTDRLYVTKPGSAPPALVTEYKTGQVQSLEFAPDAPAGAPHIYFVYGSSNRDIVLLSGLR
jgi:serine/threonine protein kinase/Tol biopolymer transport system component